jgi:hypothetical protein
MAEVAFPSEPQKYSPEYPSQHKKISVKQVKAARMLLGWSQADLGKAADLGEVTVPCLEARDGDLVGRPESGKKIMEQPDQGMPAIPAGAFVGENLARHVRQGSRGYQDYKRPAVVTSRAPPPLPKALRGPRDRLERRVLCLARLSACGSMPVCSRHKNSAPRDSDRRFRSDPMVPHEVSRLKDRTSALTIQ